MTTVVEKCLCDSELSLEWNDNEKFKDVRCPKCNTEMRFKNPNFNKETNNNCIDECQPKISDERVTKIIEKVVGNNKPYCIEPVKKIVTKIIEMEDETENSISNLLGEDVQKFTSEQLFDINKLVLEACSKFNIKLNRSNYKDQIVGSPYNIPFKKVDGRLKCPNCNKPLLFLAPDGTTLNCDKCGKYYINDNGSVGKETSRPYAGYGIFY